MKRLIALAVAVMLLSLGIVVRSASEDDRSTPDVDVAAPPSGDRRTPVRDAAPTTVAPISIAATEPEPVERRRSVIPDGVSVALASDAVNLAARTELARAFAANGNGFLEPGLSGKGVVCGPFLWSLVREEPALRDADSIPLEITVPDAAGSGTRMEGRVFRGDGVAPFLKVLRSHYAGFEAPQVEFPTPRDYATYWALVPFDIEEPLFVLTSGERRILINLAEDSSLFWIDDFSLVDDDG